MEAEILKKIKTIELNSRKLINEGLLGFYKSAFKGMGMQFREFRPYVYGDDVRHISWSVSARTQDPVLKLFEEERERSLFMMVDVSASLRRGPIARKKAERLTEIFGTFALSAHEAGDNLGLLLYSDAIEKVIPSAFGKTHLLRIIRDVLLFEPKSTKTDPEVAISKTKQLLKKKSIVILLSDMEKLPSKKSIRQLSQKHDVIAIHIKQNKNLGSLGSLGFLELESAEGNRPVTINSSSRSIKNYFKSFFKTHDDVVKSLFQSAGADYLSVPIEEDYVKVLRSFFKRRSQRRS